MHLWIAIAFSQVDTIQTNIGAIEVRQSNGGIEVGLGLNWMRYSEKTERYLPNHSGPVFRIGGFKGPFHFTGFFKPWTVELAKEIVIGGDTVQQYSDINPIRTGFEVGASKDWKALGLGAFMTHSAFLLGAAETTDEKKVEFPTSHLISIGVQVSIPILKVHLKTNKRKIEKGRLLIKSRAEYYFGDLSKSYREFGSNGLANSIEVSYEMNNIVTTILENNDE
jgi:hypothetical protein